MRNQKHCDGLYNMHIHTLAIIFFYSTIVYYTVYVSFMVCVHFVYVHVHLEN